MSDEILSPLFSVEVMSPHLYWIPARNWLQCLMPRVYLYSFC